ncbi:hypothetical protein BU24DRAFT_479663 [Aaosphaeria arxii CBS 175.79]|uniref:SnoaL-like domain-containing protein n=1 Tax=Aaosphaeria arxii CBS 175.79 TaxID=1450172 RepID=A0A6A5XYL6_9PLEO|nr:uncharacterized protein BU24DRAFT_479663 [Aaosphaeria arxii CBS 175.79]KAF2018262.1 hypothetical protein BU24DRAFT_479663 [Aaosphaeria arxii CBS 175.79]
MSSLIGLAECGKSTASHCPKSGADNWIFLLFLTNTPSAICLATVLANGTLNELARDLERVESIRAIKNVQRTYSQLAQFGRYDDMATLFAPNGTLRWGNSTANGVPAIASWLHADSGQMNGLNPGSLDTLIAENPVVSLSVDGHTAKARWNGLRFQGDGQGATRIQGGIYENEYIQTDQGWKLSLLNYYAMYAGPYVGGWRNVGGGLPIVPYHFTPEGSGIPIPKPVGEAPMTNHSIADLEKRIGRLNDEDSVRNLMHAHGYYVDRRMWTDVVELHTTNTTVQIHRGADTTIFTGLAGARTALERMGPEGLVQGINNDHPIFDMIVEVDLSGKKAIARGVEIAMVGDAKNRTASWEFNVFRNHLIKEDGLWKVQTIDITPLVVADYYKGWGDGGINPHNTHVPPFLNRSSHNNPNSANINDTETSLDELNRRLARSAGFDGAENQSHAYGYLLDDLQCGLMGDLFAKRGHKASPFAGFFITPERITKACYTSYGTNRSALRSSISFHWRPQPVVLVSEDGRSATLRARLLQPSTSTTRAGSFNGAIYHDQMVLEDGKWRLWSVTIDEFYWQSASWEGGWSDAKPRNSSEPNPGGAGWTKNYPPDITIADIGEREATFRGGSVSQSRERPHTGLLLAWMCSMSSETRLGAGSKRIPGASHGSIVANEGWADENRK